MKKLLNFSLFMMLLLMTAMWTFWLFFDTIAFDTFEVQTNSSRGINTIKSDVGGAFLCLATCLFLYFRQGKQWLYPTAVLLACILFSRVISLLLDGFDFVILLAIGLEISGLVIIGVLLKLLNQKSSL